MPGQTLKRVRRVLLDPSLAWEAIKWRTWWRFQVYLNERKVRRVERALAGISPTELERLRIEQLSSALQRSGEEVATYVEELQADHEFLDAFNDKLSEMGLITPESTASVADNCTLYCVVRAVKPKVIIETGVHLGGTTAFLLRAIERNQSGELYSIDLPTPALPPRDDPHGEGCLVPHHLRSRWTLINANSRVELPPLLEQLQNIDMFLHDSEHTYRMMTWEYEEAWVYLSEGGVLASHDVLMTRAFDRFCRRHRAEITSQAMVGNVGVAMKRRVV